MSKGKAIKGWSYYTLAELRHTIKTIVRPKADIGWGELARKYKITIERVKPIRRKQVCVK